VVFAMVIAHLIEEFNFYIDLIKNSSDYEFIDGYETIKRNKQYAIQHALLIFGLCAASVFNIVTAVHYLKNNTKKSCNLENTD
jgi:hypothetical protein